MIIYRKGHGTSTGNNSGASTPFSGSQTPNKSEADESKTLADPEQAVILSEKLRHKGSFQRARIVPSAKAATQKPSGGLTKEHQEQGRVKKEVYKEYIKAASKAGFALFLFTTLMQQVASVAATLTLRAWGEHNQASGNNSGMMKYLLLYGLFSFSQSVLGAVAATTMWVFCALKSARKLHDSVSTSILRSVYAFFFFWLIHLLCRCWNRSCMPL